MPIFSNVIHIIIKKLRIENWEFHLTDQKEILMVQIFGYLQQTFQNAGNPLQGWG